MVKFLTVIIGNYMKIAITVSDNISTSLCVKQLFSNIKSNFLPVSFINLKRVTATVNVKTIN